MGVEYIRSVKIKNNDVYLTSKSSNDGLPYISRKNESLTKVFHEEGKLGLDREVLKMLSEYSEIRENSHSMYRYDYALREGKKDNLRANYDEKCDAYYKSLARYCMDYDVLDKTLRLAHTYPSFLSFVESANYFYPEDPIDLFDVSGVLCLLEPHEISLDQAIQRDMDLNTILRRKEKKIWIDEEYQNTIKNFKELLKYVDRYHDENNEKEKGGKEMEL